VVERVDEQIYLDTYFATCMDCTFCHDWCCLEGAGVEVPVMEQILAHADALEAVVGVPRRLWFEEALTADVDYPGGRYTSTRVVEGACVFLNRRGRGCLLHQFALEKGIDVHTIKPLACTAYPLWCDEGLLRAQQPVRDRKLVCAGSGPSLYRGTRGALAHQFGADLVAELDAVEAAVHAGSAQALRTISLPVLTSPPDRLNS
jgi:Fe-S-cluster containining protein